MEFFDFDAPDEARIRVEKNKARDLRKTRWWQQKTASGICHYCGRKTVFREITMDHVVPLSRGGKSTRNNLVPACKTCNSRKKSMLPLEWEEYLEKISGD